MPDVTFPTIDLNKAAEDLNHAVRDGLYVAVGLGVLGFQRAQVRRVELTKQLESQFGDLSSLPSTINARLEPYARVAREQLETARGQVTELAKAVDEVVEPARKQLDEQVSRLEEQLPAGARSMLQTVRDAAASQEQLFRSAVGLD